MVSDDAGLIEDLYQSVHSSLSLKRMEELSQDDKDFLVEFFTKGSEHPNPNINKYSKDALSKLKGD
jgi:hypothetical protein